MRLFFDLQPYIQASRYGITGIARWTIGAIGHLVPAAPGWEIEGFAIAETDGGIEMRLKPQNAKLLVPLWSGSVTLIPDTPYITDSFSNPPDAILGPAFLTPASRKSAEIPVIHDMAYVHHPETHPEQMLQFIQGELPAVVKRASLIVTVSKAMKDEISDHFGIDPGMIEVVYPGSPNATSPFPDGAHLPGVPQDYYLVVGTLEPRKNIRAILQAHCRLRKNDPLAPKLVFAGAVGWKTEQFAGLLDEQVDAGNAVCLKYVSQSSLNALYRRAAALVFPSLYEGFGLPIVEAMAAGCPVITSNCSGMREAAAEAALLVDPAEPEEIEQAMKQVIEDSGLREDLKTRGLARAAYFTWQKTAEQLKGAVSKGVDLKRGMSR